VPQTHFANRHAESLHLADARQFLNDYRAATSFDESIGADAPRRNVLFFYGMGGIGKSALLIELVARVVS
jgi:DNA replication protein DnaC